LRRPAARKVAWRRSNERLSLLFPSLYPPVISAIGMRVSVRQRAETPGPFSTAAGPGRCGCQIGGGATTISLVCLGEAVKPVEQTCLRRPLGSLVAKAHSFGVTQKAPPLAGVGCNIFKLTFVAGALSSYRFLT